MQNANLLTPAQQYTCTNAVQWLPFAQLSSDARKISAGDVFVAYAFDAQHDGRAYVQQACDNGAAGVLWQDDGQGLTCAAANLGVTELNVLAGHIAHAHYGQPSAQMDMVAITGTNGKTSCAQWVAQLLSALECKCAMVGTLGAGFVNAMVETGFTTPQAIEVHRWLADLHAQGAQATVMEVSSHALEQGRVNGVAFDVALFTNLSRDHLDYHGDMASYEAAKAQLFTWHGLKSAVINLDDEAGQRMAQVAAAHGISVMGYGLTAQAGLHLQARNIRAHGAHTVFDLHVAGQVFEVTSGLVGQFNVLNLLGVLGVVHALGFDWAQVIPLCAEIVAAPGRMQRFGGAEQPLVVVDFAHTPDALDKTLRALAPIAQQRGGRLITVFGCGGDRDAGKRPQMGALAAQLSDQVWITSDNPRTEDPHTIVQQIQAGAVGRAEVRVEIERRVAIAQAIGAATAQDVVLVAGKGHEAYQDILGVKHPYSDIQEVEQALRQWTRTA
ncbi:MAG: UDP-N-acetylmuramoyl-L-alanyl-D-glutamate--2,6-diaminopimelate ligase [Formosimonas sp.]